MNKKGMGILEYVVYLPIMVITLFAIYSIMTNMMQTNNETSDVIAFNSQATELDAQIMKSIVKGGNSVSYLNGSAEEGLVINGDTHDFKSVIYSKLNAKASISGNTIILTYTYRGNDIIKRFNVRFWGRTYE